MEKTPKSETSGDEIVVTGAQFRGKATPLRLSTDPSSDAASVTVLSAEDIKRQAARSNIDIFRSIPGVQVSDFGQNGNANGISIRGWPGANDSNALAYYLDGVQRNSPSGTGANGYLNTTPLIPEVLGSIVVVKGPFDTRYGGNFALAGSAVLTTADQLPSSISLSGGSYGRVRGVLTLGLGSREGISFYTAIAGQHDGGYQQNGGQDQLGTFSKLGLPVRTGRLTLSFQTFNQKYGSPGYLDLANIKSGVTDPKSAASDTDGGKTRQYTGIAHFTQDIDGLAIETTGYILRDDRTRYATFTPYPQAYSHDDRKQYGFSFDPHLNTQVFGMETQIRAGASVRFDDIKDTRLPSIDGEPVAQRSPFDVYSFELANIEQTQLSAYGEIGVKPASWLKVTIGERYDHFHYKENVTTYAYANNSYNNFNVKSGTGKGQFKGSIAAQPLKALTIYANIGQSITSPDGYRAVFINPGLSPSVLTSKEVGAALNSLHGLFHVQGNYYETSYSNEVTFVGLTAVNQGKTHRRGYDTEASAIVLRTPDASVRFYGNYSHIKGRLQSGGPIPNISDWVASYGFRADLPVKADHLSLDLGQTWSGPQVLGTIANKNISGKTSTRINGRVEYSFAGDNKLKIFTSAIIYPGSRFDEFGFVLTDRVYVSSAPRARFDVGAAIQF